MSRERPMSRVRAAGLPRLPELLRFPALLLLGWCFLVEPIAAGTGSGDNVDWQWGVKIPLPDGIRLNATVYRPHDQREPLPCVFTLTPYVSDTYHDRGMYFAQHGYVFLIVDTRGRGNSEGQFQVMREAADGRDIVEWLARQPYCDGKVAMWGGSYAGMDQWQTASKHPPHLATIVPAAAAMPGVDAPVADNIWAPDEMQWVTIVTGRTLQEKTYGDNLSGLSAIAALPRPICRTRSSIASSAIPRRYSRRKSHTPTRMPTGMRTTQQRRITLQSISPS